MRFESGTRFLSGFSSAVVSLAAASAFFFIFAAQESFAEDVQVKRKLSGTFLTNVAGSSVNQPPYIQVIRSKEGLEYLLSEFERHKNRITKSRVDSIRKKLSGLDYDRNMLVGVFSQPMDNYRLSLDKMTLDTESKAIDVEVSYQHKIKNYRIPPKKSIYYTLAVIPKSDYPVILDAKEIVSSKNKPDAKLITITGRLMPISDDGLQLVPVVIKRGNKNSYYIKGDQAEPLSRHLGKVVTLQGTVSRERNSPYEWDFTVKRIVKIFN